MEDAKVKEVEVKNSAERDHERETQRRSVDKQDRPKLQGKALQINQNSVGGQDPAPKLAPPRRDSGEKPNEQKLQGKALQINKNSAED
jgi:hypothetical protein